MSLPFLFVVYGQVPSIKSKDVTKYPWLANCIQIPKCSSEEDIWPWQKMAGISYFYPYLNSSAKWASGHSLETILFLMSLVWYMLIRLGIFLLPNITLCGLRYA